MAKSAKYIQFIKCVCRENLIKLWEECLKDTYDKDFWNDGKLLEYIVLRGFELSIGYRGKTPNHSSSINLKMSQE